MHDELDRQTARLTELDYPSEIRSYVDPLHALLDDLLDDLPAAPAGDYPLLLVVTAALVPTVSAVERTSVRGRPGWTDMHDELATYRTIDGVEVPSSPVYLLLDVSTGPETLDVRPDDALPVIRSAGRTPLTVDEGVALLTQFPSVFADHHAFQAVGTRSPVAPYTKRVPSLWVSKGAPRLGWCWAGNPHTWLGSASAARRVG
jgi:hypothetical protein